MDLEKIYHDRDGNECNIFQLVKRCPELAANIIQRHEKEISQQANSPDIESQVVCILCKGKSDDRAHYCQWCGDFLRR